MSESTQTPTAELLKHIEPAIHTLAVPVDSLATDPANARKHSTRNLQAIRGSLQGFRQQKPIVVDERGVCVAGSGTLEAALALGWKWIAAVRTTLDPGTARAYGIADNRTAELAEWDDAALAEIMKQITEEADLQITGFDQDEIDRIINQVSGSPVVTLNGYADRPPTMSWVLIGIPTARFGEIADTIESMAQIEGIILETTANDGKRQ